MRPQRVRRPDASGRRGGSGPHVIGSSGASVSFRVGQCRSILGSSRHSAVIAGTGSGESRRRSGLRCIGSRRSCNRQSGMVACLYGGVLDASVILPQLIRFPTVPMSSFPSSSGAKRPLAEPLPRRGRVLGVFFPVAFVVVGSRSLSEVSYCFCVVKLLRGDRTAGGRLSSPQLLPQPCGLSSTLTSGWFRAPAGTICRDCPDLVGWLHATPNWVYSAGAVLILGEFRMPKKGAPDDSIHPHVKPKGVFLPVIHSSWACVHSLPDSRRSGVCLILGRGS